MHLLVWLRRCVAVDHDALADFREGIARVVSALGALAMLPFVLLNLWRGDTALAIAAGTAMLVLALNVRQISVAGCRLAVPLWLVLAALNAGVVATTAWHGMRGAPWAYPMLLVGYFVLPRRWATLQGLLLCVGVAAGLVAAVDTLAGVRAAATLVLTLVLLNVVLHVIGQLQGALQQQAVTDPLTGAYNRRHLTTRLHDLSQPLRGVPCALLAIDIDHFKRINDRFGHAAGDAVLQATVAAINGRKRRDDQLFRTGGEEFVLLLPATTPADAVHLADDLRLRIAATPMVAGELITVSIGVSGHRDGVDASQWLRAADAALYDAKRNGRNRTVAAETPVTPVTPAAAAVA